jgi:hypothetical protein
MVLLPPKLLALAFGISVSLYKAVRWSARRLAPRALRRKRRHLDWDLYLTTGTRSIKLFSAGGLDVYRFFHRHTVSREHDLEYVSYVKPTFLGLETIKPYGLFRIRTDAATPLPTVESVERTLAGHYGHGLVHLPNPSELLGGRRYGHLEAGYNWIEPPPQNVSQEETESESRFSVADMLEILRTDLTSLERIAWIEQAFTDSPEHGDIAHRYYIDQDGDVHLVRHHWHWGKTLFEAETTRAAKRAVRRATRNSSIDLQGG